MKSLVLAALAALLLVQFPEAWAEDVPLPRTTPESQGISSQAIGDFVQALDKINTLHSFMILRRGQVVAEGWWKPEGPAKLHKLASLTKSFISTAVGLALEDGKLALDDQRPQILSRRRPCRPFGQPQGHDGARPSHHDRRP